MNVFGVVGICIGISANADNNANDDGDERAEQAVVHVRDREDALRELAVVDHRRCLRGSQGILSLQPTRHLYRLVLRQANEHRTRWLNNATRKRVVGASFN